ncbi:MAG: glycosyltransferase, partial [Candidatus Acidiferrum sp.]
AVGVAQDAVTVRWHAGVGNLIRGTTKNFFAAFGYRLAFAVFGCAAMLLLNILPVLGLLLGHGWIRLFSAMAVVVAVSFHVGVDLGMRVSPLYGLTYPLGAALFCYMVARSTVVTLWQGGVIWRDTFYPLKELKRGVV